MTITSPFNDWDEIPGQLVEVEMGIRPVDDVAGTDNEVELATEEIVEDVALDKILGKR